MGGVPPSKPMPQWGTSHLKMKPPPHVKNNPSPLKSEAPSQEMIPRKDSEKQETVINTCLSIIKQHWRKKAEIPQEHDFLTWGIQTFVRKVKQFVRKYYVT